MQKERKNMQSKNYNNGSDEKRKWKIDNILKYTFQIFEAQKAKIEGKQSSV